MHLDIGQQLEYPGAGHFPGLEKEFLSVLRDVIF